MNTYEMKACACLKRTRQSSPLNSSNVQISINWLKSNSSLQLVEGGTHNDNALSYRDLLSIL